MSASVEIAVRSKGEIVALALVSEYDAPDVLRYSWSLTGRGYAQAFICAEPLTSLSMHRFILRLPVGAKGVVHHKNGNVLDNRRENLEYVSSQRAHMREHRGSDSFEKQWARFVYTIEVVARRSIVAARHDRYAYARGCRCDECMEANRAYMRTLRGRTPPRHGNSGYTNYRCRCEVCKAANSAYQRAQRLRKQAA